MAGSADRLRIGLVVPPWVSVPPISYGGTERVIGTWPGRLWPLVTR